MSVVNYIEMIDRLCVIEREASALAGLAADALPTTLIPTGVYPCWTNRYAGNVREVQAPEDRLVLMHSIKINFLVARLSENFVAANEQLLYTMLTVFETLMAQRRGLTSSAYPVPFLNLVKTATVLTRCSGVIVVGDVQEGTPYVGLEWDLSLGTVESINTTN